MVVGDVQRTGRNLVAHQPLQPRKDGFVAFQHVQHGTVERQQLRRLVATQFVAGREFLGPLGQLERRGQRPTVSAAVLMLPAKPQLCGPGRRHLGIVLGKDRLFNTLARPISIHQSAQLRQPGHRLPTAVGHDGQFSGAKTEFAAAKSQPHEIVLQDGKVLLGPSAQPPDLRRQRDGSADRQDAFCVQRGFDPVTGRADGGPHLGRLLGGREFRSQYRRAARRNRRHRLPTGLGRQRELADCVRHDQLARVFQNAFDDRLLTHGGHRGGGPKAADRQAGDQIEMAAILHVASPCRDLDPARLATAALNLPDGSRRLVRSQTLDLYFGRRGAQPRRQLDCRPQVRHLRIARVLDFRANHAQLAGAIVVFFQPNAAHSQHRPDAIDIGHIIQQQLATRAHDASGELHPTYLRVLGKVIFQAAMMPLVVSDVVRRHRELGSRDSRLLDPVGIHGNRVDAQLGVASRHRLVPEIDPAAPHLQHRAATVAAGTEGPVQSRFRRLGLARANHPHRVRTGTRVRADLHQTAHRRPIHRKPLRIQRFKRTVRARIVVRSGRGHQARTDNSSYRRAEHGTVSPPGKSKLDGADPDCVIVRRKRQIPQARFATFWTSAVPPEGQ